MAEDVSIYTSANPDMHYAYQLTAVYTAHSADYRGNGWWQIFRPTYRSPRFWGRKTNQNFYT